MTAKGSAAVSRRSNEPVLESKRKAWKAGGATKKGGVRLRLRPFPFREASRLRLDIPGLHAGRKRGPQEPSLVFVGRVPLYANVSLGEDGLQWAQTRLRD